MPNAYRIRGWISGTYLTREEAEEALRESIEEDGRGEAKLVEFEISDQEYYMRLHLDIKTGREEKKLTPKEWRALEFRTRGI